MEAQGGEEANAGTHSVSVEAMILSTMHTPFALIQLRNFWAGSPLNHPASTLHHCSVNRSQKLVLLYFSNALSVQNVLLYLI